jgi:pimeloyl-ACP methyl ester carboxylesterase/ketosteroid isomerase-like protein
MTDSTTARRASEVALDYLDAFGKGDADTALALLTDDVVWHVDGAPEVPTVGLRRGRDRVRRWMAVFPAAFEPLGGQVFTVADQGDDAVVCGRFHFRVKATGRTAEGDYAVRFTVRDGRIARYQIFEDSLALAAAFDVETAPGARRIRLNDTVYGYDDTGTGPVTLFLHGLFADRSMFAAQIRALTAARRCIAPDLPGHGASTWPAGGWTLDDVAEDLALLITENRWGPVALVGQSQGGMIAMRLAARHPRLVERLALVGTTARAEPADRLPQWRERRTVLETGTADDRRTLFRQLQHAATTPEWRTAHPAAAAAELDVMTGHPTEAMPLALDAAVLHRTDVRDLLPRVKTPTLILTGQHDQAMPVEWAEETAELIPDANLRVLPDAAHHLPLEAPNTVTEHLTRFLT